MPTPDIIELFKVLEEVAAWSEFFWSSYVPHGIESPESPETVQCI